MEETQSDPSKGEPLIRVAVGSTRIYSCESSHNLKKRFMDFYFFHIEKEAILTEKGNYDKGDIMYPTHKVIELNNEIINNRNASPVEIYNRWTREHGIHFKTVEDALRVLDYIKTISQMETDKILFLTHLEK